MRAAFASRSNSAGRQGPAVVTPVGADVEPREVGQRVQRRPTIPNQPACELLGGLEVVVRGLDAKAAPTKLAQNSNAPAAAISPMNFHLRSEIVLSSCRVDSTICFGVTPLFSR